MIAHRHIAVCPPHLKKESVPVAASRGAVLAYLEL